MACFLFTSVLLSAFARFHWFADLFTHFTGQYLIGGIVLFAVFMLLREWMYAGSCLLVLAYCGFAFFNAYAFTQKSVSGPTFTVVQYNKLKSNLNYDGIIQWLEDNQDRFDVVSLQEMNESGISHLITPTLNQIYPYRFPQQKTAGSDVYILSKHPLSATNHIPTSSKHLPSALGVHVQIMPEHSAPISFYAIHTKVPLSVRLQAIRNQEMTGLGSAAAKSSDFNIIMLGDWNCTPYSPHFQDLLKSTGLKNETGGILPFPTWPSHFKLPIFQIPIDHILYKGPDLQMIRKERGPAMGSDHHPVIATFMLNGDE